MQVKLIAEVLQKLVQIGLEDFLLGFPGAGNELPPPSSHSKTATANAVAANAH